MSQFFQYNETDDLKRVIIGRYDTYCHEPAYIERVNPEQLKGLPALEQLKLEMDGFRNALEQEGVEVLIPAPVGKFVYDQLTPRDLGVVIGDKFLVCNMARKSRRYEVAGILQYLDTESEKEPDVFIPDSPFMLMEGGDIIMDRGVLFVAQTSRTNREGIQYIKNTFKEEFRVVPVGTKSSAEGEDVLHLDCIFNPVGDRYALVYENGFRELPKEIQQNYELIEISRSEQQALATNVLSLSKTKVISRNHPDCERVNRLMEQKGLTVIRLPFDAVPSTGGSFRCSSLPLERVP
jgi:N-dimethylarginine dimethylaminohydrolase